MPSRDSRAACPEATGPVMGQVDLSICRAEARCRHTDRYIPVGPHLMNEVTLADRLQSFRRSAFCGISLSKLKLATTHATRCSGPQAALAARGIIGEHSNQNTVQLGGLRALAAPP
jgi:hypothetical protein